MSFVDAIRSGFSKYGTFTGRASRSEFWYFCLFLGLAFFIFCILFIVLVFADTSLSQLGRKGPFIIGFLPVIMFSLAMGLPMAAVSCRRLHDTNRSGWWQLSGTVIGWTLLVLKHFVQEYSWLGLHQLTHITHIIQVIVTMVLFTPKGDEGINRFGPSPFARFLGTVHSSKRNGQNVKMFGRRRSAGV